MRSSLATVVVVVVVDDNVRELERSQQTDIQRSDQHFINAIYAMCLYGQLLFLFSRSELTIFRVV